MLEQIRSHLHVKSRFQKFKSGQVQHQGATTHAQGSWIGMTRRYDCTQRSILLHRVRRTHGPLFILHRQSRHDHGVPLIFLILLSRQTLARVIYPFFDSLHAPPAISHRLVPSPVISPVVASTNTVLDTFLTEPPPIDHHLFSSPRTHSSAAVPPSAPSSAPFTSLVAQLPTLGQFTRSDDFTMSKSPPPPLLRLSPCTPLQMCKDCSDGVASDSNTPSPYS
jgi:hypothetical protein